MLACYVRGWGSGGSGVDPKSKLKGIHIGGVCGACPGGSVRAAS